MNAVDDRRSGPWARDAPVRFRRRELPADAEAAGQARYDFAAWLRSRFVLTPVRAIDITTAVYEATANAAEHAYSDGPTGAGIFDVDANYEAASDALTVTVEDHGKWRTRDPNTAPNIARGRGIQMMYSLADNASIVSTPTGTRVCLMWTGLELRS